MTASFFSDLLGAWGMAAAIQLLAWIVMLRTRNAGLVDAAWAASLGVIGIWFALHLGGDPLRRLLVGGMTGLWAARLTLHLWRDRIHGQPEEGRYRRLREIWKEHADLHFLWFFQAQALLAAILSVPFQFGASSTDAALSIWDIAAIALFLVGWVGETTADRQLSTFKRDAQSGGRVCRTGLWMYSRHPNYFFDWLIWCSFALVAQNAPRGEWGILSPALILLFVLKITGIPPTEAQALRSRGDAYREYQRTTSAFVPLPPRSRP